MIFLQYLALISTLYITIILCENRERRKLQIGVKRRAENCTMKTKKGDLMHVKYKGMFDNGEEFDSSDDRTFTFTLGSGQVIKGWDQGLMGMCVTELRKLVVPPDLGYGKNGVPPKIPPDSTLIFHVEMMMIERDKR